MALMTGSLALIPAAREKGEGCTQTGQGPPGWLQYASRFVCGVMNQPTPFKPLAPLRRTAGRLFNGGAVLTAAVAISLAVVIGIQLGGIPWRFRRQMWQLQGALVGAALGFVVGRLSAAHPKDHDD